MAAEAARRVGGEVMADDMVQIDGDAFYRLSRALKDAGRLGMRRELTTELRGAVRPLIPMTRAAARASLPQRGGLAESVARAPQRVQVRTGATTAGVRLAVSNPRSGAQGANRGRVRHPVFGTDRWVEQDVPAGWFDDTMTREAPRVAEPAVERAIVNVVNRIVREAD